VEEVQNLRSLDFLCRYLISDDIWIPLGESLLIEQFQPLWNVLIEGFEFTNLGKIDRSRPRSGTPPPWSKTCRRAATNPLTGTHLAKMISDFLQVRM